MTQKSRRKQKAKVFTPSLFHFRSFLYFALNLSARFAVFAVAPTFTKTSLLMKKFEAGSLTTQRRRYSLPSLSLRTLTLSVAGSTVLSPLPPLATYVKCIKHGLFVAAIKVGRVFVLATGICNQRHLVGRRAVRQTARYKLVVISTYPQTPPYTIPQHSAQHCRIGRIIIQAYMFCILYRDFFIASISLSLYIHKKIHTFSSRRFFACQLSLGMVDLH